MAILNFPRCIVSLDRQHNLCERNQFCFNLSRTKANLFMQELESLGESASERNSATDHPCTIAADKCSLGRSMFETLCTQLNGCHGNIYFAWSAPSTITVICNPLFLDSPRRAQYTTRVQYQEQSAFEHPAALASFWRAIWQQ